MDEENKLLTDFLDASLGEMQWMTGIIVDSLLGFVLWVTDGCFENECLTSFARNSPTNLCKK